MTQEINTTVLGSDVSLRFSAPWAAYWLAFVRILTGWYIFRSGLTKILDWPFDASGYLLQGSAGTVLEPLLVFVGNTGPLLAVTNFMVPVGELLIGVGLIFGGFVRLASFFGALLMGFFYFTNADWAAGAFTIEIAAMLLFMTLAVFGAGRVFGIDRYLESMNWAQNRWARLLMG
ncbi:MAG: DoxX family protein [Halobacteriota archaeon]